MDTPDHLEPLALAAENTSVTTAAIVQPAPQVDQIRALHNGDILHINGPELEGFWRPHTSQPDFVKFLGGSGYQIQAPLPEWLQNGTIAFLQDQILQWERNEYRPGLVGEARLIDDKQTACAQAQVCLQNIARTVEKKPTIIRVNGKAFLIIVAKRVRLSLARQTMNRRLVLVGDAAMLDRVPGSNDGVGRPDVLVEDRDREQAMLTRLLEHPDIQARPVVRRLIMFRYRNGGKESRAVEAAAIGVSIKVLKAARAYMAKNYERLWTYASQSPVEC